MYYHLSYLLKMRENLCGHYGFSIMTGVFFESVYEVSFQRKCSSSILGDWDRLLCHRREPEQVSHRRIFPFVYVVYHSGI